eukprot:SAG31_NODE_13193_length_886_cov_2.247776_1_plen_137_part_10
MLSSAECGEALLRAGCKRHTRDKWYQYRILSPTISYYLILLLLDRGQTAMDRAVDRDYVAVVEMIQRCFPLNHPMCSYHTMLQSVSCVALHVAAFVPSCEERVTGQVPPKKWYSYHPHGNPYVDSDGEQSDGEDSD